MNYTPRKDRLVMMLLLQQGWSIRRVARETGLSRNTVKAFLKLADLTVSQVRKMTPMQAVEEVEQVEKCDREWEEMNGPRRTRLPKAVKLAALSAS